MTELSNFIRLNEDSRLSGNIAAMDFDFNECKPAICR
jgi:hypothetical protein